MASTSRIIELASMIQVHTADIDSYLSSQGLPSPSWDLDTPPKVLLSDAAQVSQNALLESMEELKALILGPVPFLMNKATDTQSALLGLHAVVEFDIASSFPITEEASFANISRTCGLAEDDTKRFLRFAMTDRVFKEPRKGVVAHTPASKALCNSWLRGCIWQICQELWPAASRTIDALVKWPGSEEPTQTGFNLANNTDDPIFVELGKHPERAKRFADAMTYFNMKPGFENKHIVEGYDWAAIGNGLLVDVGGSHGSLSRAVLEHYPEIRCVVQDRPDIVKTANVPPALANRLKFQAHDFFTKQPLSADIYLLRWVLHNWSDKRAIKILRSLVPALKYGAKILVVEICLPEPGVFSQSDERQARNLDMAMKQLLNAKERSAEDWVQLFQEADPRFRLTQINKPELSELSIIEFSWEEHQ